MSAKMKLSLITGLVGLVVGLSWTVFRDTTPTRSNGDEVLSGQVSIGGVDELALGSSDPLSHGPVASEPNASRSTVTPPSLSPSDSGESTVQEGGATILVRVVGAEPDTPIIGAPVSLSVLLPGGEETQVMATSDSEGRASFGVVAPVELLRVTLERTPSRPPLTEQKRMEVPIGASIDLVLRAPEPGAVEGLVVNELGLPVPGAEVQCWMNMFYEIGRQDYASPQRRTAADNAGRFRIEGVAGTTTLRAVADQRTSRHLVYGRVQPGKVVAGLQLEVVPFRSLSGQVLTAAGHPVPGASVSGVLQDAPSIHIDKETRFSFWRGLQRVKATDEEGRFTFEVEDDVALRIRVYALEYPNAEAIVAPGQDSVVIVLSDGVTLPGCVRDLSGKPVADAEVFVFGRKTHSNEHGLFAITGLTPEVAQKRSLPLVVRAAGYALHVIELDSIEQGMAPVEVTLEPGFVLAGHVVDGDGIPVPCARLFLRGDRRLQVDTNPDQDGTHRTWESLARYNRFVTEADGSFHVEDLYAGHFRIEVKPPGFSSLRAVHYAASGRNDVTIVLGTGLAELVKLRGRVFDAATGLPVEDFQILLEPPPRSTPPGTHHPGGVFELEDLHESTTRLLIRTLDMDMVGRRTLRDLRPGLHEIDLPLRRCRVFRVRVVDADGNPLKNCPVEAHEVADRPMGLLSEPLDRLSVWWETLTDQKGLATIAMVPYEGTVYIAVQTSEGTPTQRFELDLSEPLENEIQELRLR